MPMLRFHVKRQARHEYVLQLSLPSRPHSPDAAQASLLSKPAPKSTPPHAGGCTLKQVLTSNPVGRARVGPWMLSSSTLSVDGSSTPPGRKLRVRFQGGRGWGDLSALRWLGAVPAAGGCVATPTRAHTAPWQSSSRCSRARAAGRTTSNGSLPRPHPPGQSLALSLGRGCSHKHAHTHTHARTHACTPTHAHTHMHARTPTHARMQAHTHAPEWQRGREVLLPEGLRGRGRRLPLAQPAARLCPRRVAHGRALFCVGGRARKGPGQGWGCGCGCGCECGRGCKGPGQRCGCGCVCGCG